MTHFKIFCQKLLMVTNLTGLVIKIYIFSFDPNCEIDVMNICKISSHQKPLHHLKLKLGKKYFLRKIVVQQSSYLSDLISNLAVTSHRHNSFCGFWLADMQTSNHLWVRFGKKSSSYVFFSTLILKWLPI